MIYGKSALLDEESMEKWNGKVKSVEKHIVRLLEKLYFCNIL